MARIAAVHSRLADGSPLKGNELREGVMELLEFSDTDKSGAIELNEFTVWFHRDCQERGLPCPKARVHSVSPRPLLCVAPPPTHPAAGRPG